METAPHLTTQSNTPLVILSPTANRGHIEQHRTLIRQRLEHEQGEYIETSYAGEAKILAQQAGLANRPVIIAGGDGSVNEVINGILQTGRSVPLGIIPAGSGNDFATSTLHLPLSPEAAIEKAFNGQPVTVDAGKVNGHYFVNACGIGLDADIAKAVERLKKYPLMSGSRLYYTATLRQLLFGYHQCPWLTLQIDEQPALKEQRYILIAVSNGPAYGAGFRINPAADYRDGLFDICAIDYTPLLRALKLLPVVKKGQHIGLPEVTVYRGRHLTIESRAPVNIQIDGETARSTHFDIELLPGALCIRV